MMLPSRLPECLSTYADLVMSKPATWRLLEISGAGCSCRRMPQSKDAPHTLNRGIQLVTVSPTCPLTMYFCPPWCASVPYANPGAGIFFCSLVGFPLFISSAFAQTAPAAAAGGDMQSSLMSMLPLVLMFVVLYFVMIRPQMKKQKEHKTMIDALAKGDEVVTAGGVLGRVSKVGDTYVGLEVASGVEVQIQRSAVVQVLPKGSIK
jgi:preprotein translocase subunit YajC